MDTLYILTRTSGRPQFFANCRESVKALSWPGEVVHIVHSDDPRCEDYIECDILIRGEKHGSYMGTAPYNLYNNRLLDAVPSDGWVYYLDDDDMLCGPDVFNFLIDANKERMQVCKAQRWNETIWPKNWKKQKSFQTECFVNWLPNARLGKWWCDKGGDHYYTRQLTKQLALDWHDVLVCKAQEGKGHGKLVDIGGELMDFDSMSPDDTVHIKMDIHYRNKMGGKLYKMPFSDARVLERYELGHITYQGLDVIPGDQVGSEICLKVV